MAEMISCESKSISKFDRKIIKMSKRLSKSYVFHFSQNIIN